MNGVFPTSRFFPVRPEPVEGRTVNIYSALSHTLRQIERVVRRGPGNTLVGNPGGALFYGRKSVLILPDSFRGQARLFQDLIELLPRPPFGLGQDHLASGEGMDLCVSLNLNFFSLLARFGPEEIDQVVGEKGRRRAGPDVDELFPGSQVGL